jgi:plasmid stability protein
MGLFYIREICKQEANMSTMTIRGLDELTVTALKEKAKQEGTSVNAALVKLLQEELGLKKKKRTVVYNDLDHLAGTWSDKEYKEFQKRIKDFETIDETMWK